MDKTPETASAEYFRVPLLFPYAFEDRPDHEQHGLKTEFHRIHSKLEWLPSASAHHANENARSDRTEAYVQGVISELNKLLFDEQTPGSLINIRGLHYPHAKGSELPALEAIVEDVSLTEVENWQFCARNMSDESDRPFLEAFIKVVDTTGEEPKTYYFRPDSIDKIELLTPRSIEEGYVKASPAPRGAVALRAVNDYE